MSYKIQFKKLVNYNHQAGFYDNEPQHSAFYEKDYLLINPTLHKQDAEAKFQIIKECISIISPSNKIQTIADFGCGFCAVLIKILDYLHKKIDNNISAVGIDISSNILVNGGKQPYLIKLRSNCENNPLSDCSISLSFCIDLIEHVKNPNSLLREISRISKFAIFKIPIELSLFTVLKGGKKRLYKLERKYGHIHHFNRKSIIHNIENYFDIIYETYSKIPNRMFLIDKLQDIIIKLKLYKLYSISFGGFIILATKSKFHKGNRNE